MSTESLDAAAVSIMQLSDSFFPTGMYANSSGLESIFYSKKIMSAKNLHDLIRVFLQYQIGPTDCTALGNAYGCASIPDLKKIIEIDCTVNAMKLVQEIRHSSARSGSQLVRCMSSFIPDDKPICEYLNAISKHEAYGMYPVALALAANALSIPKNKAGLILLYSFSISVIGAALRLGMLQHFQGQQIIHELKPTISKVVEFYIDRPIESMWQLAPQIDIMQMKHETMNSKMFIT